VTVEETVGDLVQKIRGGAFHDATDPAFHNIRWLDLLEETRTKLGYPDSVLSLSSEQLRQVRAATKQRSAVACD